MFPHIFEKERLICEWRLYRTGLYKANRNKQKYDHFWSQFLFDAAWTKSNPNLYILVSMMIVICLASVNCERGFSTMVIIKSSTRNTFLVSTVRHVMLIQKSKWNMNDWLGHLSLIVGKFRDMKERRGPYATRERKRWEWLLATQLVLFWELWRFEFFSFSVYVIYRILKLWALGNGFAFFDFFCFFDWGNLFYLNEWSYFDYFEYLEQVTSHYSLRYFTYLFTCGHH